MGIVYEDGDLNSFVIIEQNWNGWANKRPLLRRDYYQNILCFIVPQVAKEVKTVTTTKTTAPVQRKPVSTTVPVAKTVRYVDEIVNYDMKLRGRNPKGIVLHNDAGGKTASQYRATYLNASVQTLENGIAHSYISERQIWEAIPDKKMAWHTA